MLTPDQMSKLSEIRNPLAKQRFALFFQLPQDLQNSMTDEKTSGSIWTITKDKYQLPDSKVSAVAKIIGLIFLGELLIKNFIAELKNELNVDVATAQAIAQDINQAIFQPVRNSLMAVHGIDKYANQRTPKENLRFPTGQVRANDTNQMQNKIPNQPVQPQNNNEVQRRRDEVLRKIRPPLRSDQNHNSTGQAPPARPASYNIPRQNVVNLRNIKRKNKYNGFFT